MSAIRCRLFGHAWSQFKPLVMQLYNMVDNGTLRQQTVTLKLLAPLKPRIGNCRTMPVRVCLRCLALQTWDEAHAHVRIPA